MNHHKLLPIFICSLSMLSACGEPSSTSVPSEPSENSVTVSSDACNHRYGSPTYTWAEDYSSCTAERVCRYDETHVERETVNSTFVVTLSANCGREGEGYYSAVFVNPAFEEQRHSVAIPKEEHVWGEPIYNWNEKNTACEALLICENNNTHRISEEVWATVETPVLPTAESAGMMRFTAEFAKDCFETQVKEISMTLEEYTEFNIKFVLNEDENSYAVEMVSFYYLLNEISVPASYKGLPVTTIKSDSMSRSSLHSIILPDSITKIEADAFNSLSLTNLVLSDNLIEMDSTIDCGAFTSLTRTELNKISYIGSRTNPYFCCIGGINYNYEAQWDNIHSRCKIISSIGWMSVGSSSRTVLPVREGIVCLSPGCLYGFADLTTSKSIATITLPSSLRHIGDGGLGYFNAFNAVELAEGNTSFKMHEDGYLMTADEKTVILGNRNLNATEITFPNTVTNIQTRAFRGCRTAATFILPDDIRIGQSAFRGSNIIGVEFHTVYRWGATRWEIGMPYEIFYYASNLATVNFRNTIQAFKDYYGRAPECFKTTAARKATCTDGIYPWSY